MNSRQQDQEKLAKEIFDGLLPYEEIVRQREERERLARQQDEEMEVFDISVFDNELIRSAPDLEVAPEYRPKPQPAAPRRYPEPVSSSNTPINSISHSSSTNSSNKQVVAPIVVNNQQKTSSTTASDNNTLNTEEEVITSYDWTTFGKDNRSFEDTDWLKSLEDSEPNSNTTSTAPAQEVRATGNEEDRTNKEIDQQIKETEQEVESESESNSISNSESVEEQVSPVNNLKEHISSSNETTTEKQKETVTEKPPSTPFSISLPPPSSYVPLKTVPPNPKEIIAPTQIEQPPFVTIPTQSVQPPVQQLQPPVQPPVQPTTERTALSVSSTNTSNTQPEEVPMRTVYLVHTPYPIAPYNVRPTRENPIAVTVPVRPTPEQRIPENLRLPPGMPEMFPPRCASIFIDNAILITFAGINRDDPNDLVPAGMIYKELEIEIEDIPVDYTKKTKEETIRDLKKNLGDEFKDILCFLDTKNVDTISKRTLTRREEPFLSKEDIESIKIEEIRRYITDKNWAEAIFCSSAYKSLDEIIWLYAKATTRTFTDAMYLILAKGHDQLAVNKISDLTEEEIFDVVLDWEYLLKGAIIGKCSEFCIEFAKLFYYEQLLNECVTVLFLARSALTLDPMPLFDTYFGFRMIESIFMYKAFFNDPISLEEIVYRYLECISEMNQKKAQSIYLNTLKDHFSDRRKPEVEKMLKIERTTWGLTTILNVMDRGISLIVGNNPADASPQTPQPQVLQAPQTPPALPSSTENTITNNVSVAHTAPTTPTALPPPETPLSKALKEEAKKRSPNAPVKTSFSVPRPGLKRKVIPATTTPTTTTTKPTTTTTTTTTTPTTTTTTPTAKEQKYPYRPPKYVRKPDINPIPDDDSIDYRKFFSDKTKYEILDDSAGGSWLGAIPGVSRVTGFLKKMMLKKDNIPVVELSQTTCFVYDKIAKRWITVDSKTLRPIKIKVTQGDDDDKPSEEKKKQPLPVMPVMPKKPEGPILKGPAAMPSLSTAHNSGLASRYGKPMGPSAASVDESMTASVPINFHIPPPNNISKNAKVFIPKAPESEEGTG